MKKNKRVPFKTIVFWFVLIILIISAIYSAVMMICAPTEQIDADTYQKLRSDYILMLGQCVLGILTILLPSFIERRFKIDIPNYMEVVYFVFLFGAIYLGEIRNFYIVVPNWDTYLHTLSGVMLGALGFYLVQVLNGSVNIRVQLSPFFICLFAFCFAVSLGAIWEIYEFSFDGIFGANMQRYMLEDGTQLLGHAALRDTMKDLMVDTLGALVICIIGFFTVKRNKPAS